MNGPLVLWASVGASARRVNDSHVGLTTLASNYLTVYSVRCRNASPASMPQPPCTSCPPL
jgi:hypothetical protein